MTSRLYSVPVKNMESSRARSLSNFFHVSKPVPPLSVWKSIWAVFRVFSFRASSIMGLLLGLRRLRLPVRERPRDDLADLGHREGFGQPRPGCLGEEGGHGGAQRIAGDEYEPPHQLRPPLLKLTVEARAVQDGHPEIAQDEIVLAPLDQESARSRIRQSSSGRESIGLWAESMSTGVTPSRAAHCAAIVGNTARSPRQRTYVRGAPRPWKARMSMGSTSGRSACGVSMESARETRGSLRGMSPIHRAQAISPG